MPDRMDALALPRCSPVRPASPCLAAITAVLLVTAPGPAAAVDPSLGIHGEDDRVMLDPTEWPWTALGRLNRESGGFCTGALVDRDLVLTAAHCLEYARTGRPVPPERLHFLAGYRRGAFIDHAVARRYVLPEAKRNGGEPVKSKIAGDWALVVLERAIDVKPIPVRALSPGELPGAEGAAARLMRAGYGRDRPHLLSLHDGCRVVERRARDRLLVHDCDAVPGESGSPLIVTGDGGLAIVGVNSGVARFAGVQRGVAVHARAFLTSLARLQPIGAEVGTVPVPVPLPSP